MMMRWAEIAERAALFLVGCVTHRGFETSSLSGEPA